MRRTAVLLAILVLSAAGCRSAPEGDAPNPNSGITGVVVSGPQCPIVTEASPCPDEPVPGAELDVRSTDGSFGTGVRADARGRFRRALPPGRYVIRVVVPSGGAMSSRPVVVTVEEGRFTHVDVVVDTGIR